MNKENLDININIEGGQSVDDLNVNLDKLNNTFEELEPNTDAYRESLKKLDTVQKRLNDTQKAADASTKKMVDTLNNVGKVSGGLISGLTAVKGVTALMGIENEKLEKTFVQLQAGMAIAQGANGIGGMVEGGVALTKTFKASTAGMKIITIAQKAWNAAMNANPIFLVVTALTALGGAIYSVTKYLSRNNEEQERANKLNLDAFEIDAILLSNERIAEIIEDAQTKRRIAAGESEVEILKEKIAKLNASETIAEQIYEKEKERLIKQGKTSEEEAENLALLLNNRIKLTEEIYKTQEELRTADAKAEENDKNKKTEQDQKATELRLQNIEDGRKRELAIILDTFNKELVAAENNEELKKQLRIKYNKERVDINKRYDDEELNNVKKVTDVKKLASDTVVNIVEGSMKKIETVTQASTDNLESEWNILGAQIAENWEASMNAAFDGASQVMGAISNLNNVKYENEIDAAEGNEKKIESIRKKQFESNKKIQIATTMMSGLQGVVNALGAVSTIPEPFGSILKGVNAATIATTSGINIKAIKATQYNGGGGISSNNIPSVRPPQITDRITPTRNVQNQSEIDLQAQGQRVYVLESDITNMQNKVKLRESEATF